MADLSSVAHLRMLGDEAGAQKLLDCLNRINRAWGKPEHAMPEPERQFTGLIYADASKVTPAEFLHEIVGIDFNDGPTTCGGCSETLEADGSCSVGCEETRLTVVEHLGPGRIAA